MVFSHEIQTILTKYYASNKAFTSFDVYTYTENRLHLSLPKSYVERELLKSFEKNHPSNWVITTAPVVTAKGEPKIVWVFTPLSALLHDTIRADSFQVEFPSVSLFSSLKHRITSLFSRRR